MKQNTLSLDGIEVASLPKFAEKAYLDYSMYVILDRALPHLADGLKPVQRRIIYAMSELGLANLAKHKKSARTIGDVIGKFHPHGDSACYEAMVLMAQPFSFRYPLVDGQGNFGSVDDPKSFAAMRYTEARLTPYANLLLDELSEGTVDFQPNFDATLQEPKLLPAKVPMVLLNGAMGIAVGMSTDIPPHNLTEVLNALIYMLDEPHASDEEILKFIPGPDFPTDAEIITKKSEIKKIYQTGNGNIKMRAVYRVEKEEIIITALPYQVSPGKILEQISEQMRNKKLPQVVDLRDESDHEHPIRLVIELRSNRIEHESILSHLFATTDLEKSIRINLNIIGLDERPRVYSLPGLLKDWLLYREQTVERRLKFRLEKLESRLHLLDGFLIAFLNIDEIIHIIRTEDEPKSKLMAKFKLTEIQAEAILELKLRHLARLEEMSIQAEQKKLNEERVNLLELLGSNKKLKKLIQKELKEILEKFGDKRRCRLIERDDAKILSEAEILPQEPITVILSEKGWIRAAKSAEIDPQSLSYKASDKHLLSITGKSNQTLVLLDSTGRCYNLQAYGLPSARGFGEPLTSILKPPSGADFRGMMWLEDDKKQNLLLSTSAGYGFITDFENLICKNKSGKTLISVSDDALVLPPLILKEEHSYLAVGTEEGKILIFKLDELPQLSKGKGNKIIQLKQSKITALCALAAHSPLVVKSGKASKKLNSKEWSSFIGKRAERGVTFSKQGIIELSVE